MRNHFTHISKLIRTSRELLGKSQSSVGESIGYKGNRAAQMISNIERGKCSIPYQHAQKICEFLNIKHERMKEAYHNDYSDYLEAVLPKQDP